MADLTEQDLILWLRRLSTALERDGKGLDSWTLQELGKIAGEAADQLETPDD